LLGQFCYLRVQTNDLFVEAFAVRSPFAAEDHEQRFARPARNPLSLLIAGDPGCFFRPTARTWLPPYGCHAQHGSDQTDA
jgi:hypothetical protein